MSGHSKWATIKRAKGAADAKRGAAFTRLSKDIINATRLGKSGDLNFNPILRVAVDKAKAHNMTNDKIEKAIKKGLGINDENDLTVENTYEAYGPGGVAMLIDCETDNPNRTLTDVRTIIFKAGFKTVPEGSLSWQFEEVGEIIVAIKSSTINIEDDLILKVLEYNGIKDISNDENSVKILVERDFLKETHDLLVKDFGSNIQIESIKIAKLAKNLIDLTEEEMSLLSDLMEKIYTCNDVVNIWTNLNEL